MTMMTSRGAAIRYARAVFDVVRAETPHADRAGAALEQAGRELDGFAALVAANEALARVLASPAIPAARKRGVVEQLIARAGSLQPPVAKLLLLLADRDRLGLIGDLAHAFQQRLMDYQNVVRAEVVTAVELPADRATALSDGMARLTGRQVQLRTRIDPSILGGAVARIGSTVYDGSITRQLEKMKESLAAAPE